jgi:tyrosinase
MAVRESIEGLAAAPQRFDRFRAAVARMKALPDDRRQLGNQFQGALLFPPWHRAYLYYFELALQSRLGPRFTQGPPQDANLAEVGLPWWDWTSDLSHQSGLPATYTATTAGGQPNALASARISIGTDPVTVGVWSNSLLQSVRQQLAGAVTATGAPRSLRDPGPPDDLPRAQTIEQVVL